MLGSTSCCLGMQRRLHGRSRVDPGEVGRQRRPRCQIDGEEAAPAEHREKIGISNAKVRSRQKVLRCQRVLQQVETLEQLLPEAAKAFFRQIGVEQRRRAGVDLADWGLLVAVADEGTISRAAERVGISQSGVS